MQHNGRLKSESGHGLTWQCNFAASRAVWDVVPGAGSVSRGLLSLAGIGIGCDTLAPVESLRKPVKTQQADAGTRFRHALLVAFWPAQPDCLLCKHAQHACETALPGMQAHWAVCTACNRERAEQLTVPLPHGRCANFSVGSSVCLRRSRLACMLAGLYVQGRGCCRCGFAAILLVEVAGRTTCWAYAGCRSSSLAGWKGFDLNIIVTVQGLQQAISTLATAAATLPWALTDNFMSMREGRAVVAVSGPGGPLKDELGYSYTRDAVRKVRGIYIYCI